MWFSRQEYWRGLPFPSPGDLPHPGAEPRSPTLQADALPSEPPGKSELTRAMVYEKVGPYASRLVYWVNLGTKDISPSPQGFEPQGQPNVLRLLAASVDYQQYLGSTLIPGFSIVISLISTSAGWIINEHSHNSTTFSSVQLLSRVWLFATPWIARPPCPSPTPGVYSNSCPSRWWCHPAISSSVVPFSSCPQSLPASGFFSMSQLFAWGGQSIRASTSASVPPMNAQDWSPLGWTDWISLQPKELSRVFSNTIVQKHQFFSAQLSSTVQLSHPYMTTGKTIALTRWTFVGKVMSLLFNMLSRLVITFLPRSKHLLILWLQSPSTVILDPPPK